MKINAQKKTVRSKNNKEVKIRWCESGTGETVLLLEEFNYRG